MQPVEIPAISLKQLLFLPEIEASGNTSDLPIVKGEMN